MAHQRRNPLTGEWVIVCSHRILRPWQGEEAKQGDLAGFTKQSTYLSPGAKRSNGETNPDYKSTFVFPNDFPALNSTSDIGDEGNEDNELFESAPATGECHVMCFTPRSEVSLALLSIPELTLVIEEWMKLSKELSHHRYVQIFENKGAMVGCSNSHPHCQIWSCDFIPNEIGRESEFQKNYFDKHGRPLLVDYYIQEEHKEQRLVERGNHWMAVVPYWAKWPYELLVLPRRHVTKLVDLTSEEVSDLAEVMKRYLTKYDNLFSCSFPYSMGWHEAPNTPGADNQHWQLHAHYFPPLLRSSTVKKHIAGFELFAQVQRDLTPETAAMNLNNCSGIVHFTEKDA